MIRIRIRLLRRMAVASACATLGLSASACATTDSLFEEPLFWEAVSLAADYAAYEAALDQCDWYATPSGATYQVCGDRRPDRRHRPHRPHR